LKLLPALFFLFAITGTACNSESDYSPRPRGYYRIELKPHKYKSFVPDDCPFQFEIPEPAFAIPDTNSYSEKCWYYILMPEINAQLYLTYKEVNNNFDKYAEDTRTLVYKHTARASSIDEEIVSFNHGVSGVIYEIGGEAASSLQFYVTDSTKHFLRGALYFNTAPNADSLKPVLDYARSDIRQLLQTLNWK
jgi:gliding motility-associated lipoprotein GldD